MFDVIAGPLGYLDPGTGSFILQLLIGMIVGISVAGRAFWSNIKGYYNRLRGREPEIADLASDDEAELDPAELDPAEPDADPARPL